MRGSIALRQIEHLLSNEAEDELLRDRREPGDRDFAEQPLDVILLGVAEAAMGHDGLPRGIMTGARAEKFCTVGFGAARPAIVVEPGGARRHLPCRLQIHPALGQRMLNALVLTDR